MQLLQEVKNDIQEDSEVIFDFKDVNYISSAGFRTFVSVSQMITTGSMKIINLSDEVYDIFEITGFDALLTLEKYQNND